MATLDDLLNPLGTAALKLAAKGMRIFPIIEQQKEPAIVDNLSRATIDTNVIKGWWRSRDFNIGIATGEGAGVWVLDIDGEEGEATLRALEAGHSALPPTVEAITGKGRHLYFRWPPDGPEIRNTQHRDDIPGIDVRGNGGFAIVPPSIHPSGRTYAWSVDSASEFADAPDWLINLVTNKSRSNGGPGEAMSPERWRTFVSETHDGSRRSHAIARLSGLLLRRFIDPLVALDLVRMFNALHCAPPLEEAEVIRIVTDIATREKQRRERVP
jgi:hypothetical protein